MRKTGNAGFTLVELLVATAIVMGACLVFFQLAASGQRVARTQPEAAELQQRARVAVERLQRDLLRAGAGVGHGTDAHPLIDVVPPIVPARLGARRPDSEMTFFADRISLMFVEEGAAAMPLVMDMPSGVADVPIDGARPGCPTTGLCGFSPGTRALIADTASAGNGFDLFTVQGVGAGLVHGAPDPPFSRAYSRGGTRVVAITQRVYYLDAPTNRLMVYDGYLSDVPLVENVVSLRFQYFVDPSASSAPRPPDGEGNCAYAAGSPPVPLLAALGDVTPVAAGAPTFTDGPFCGISPYRFDADLLRIRRVRVTLGLQAGDPSLRGGGPSDTRVRNVELSFDVAPRNLAPSR